MANVNVQNEFNEDLNILYNKYKHTDQFMLLLNTWITKNEDILYAQYGV